MHNNTINVHLESKQGQFWCYVHIPLPELQLYSYLDFHSEKMSKIKQPCRKRSREVQQATFRVREKWMVRSNANILNQISMEKKITFDAFWVIMWFRLDRLRDLLNVNVHVIWAKEAIETMSLKMHPYSGRVRSVRLFETRPWAVRWICRLFSV